MLDARVQLDYGIQQRFLQTSAAESLDFQIVRGAMIDLDGIFITGIVNVFPTRLQTPLQEIQLSSGVNQKHHEEWIVRGDRAADVKKRQLVEGEQQPVKRRPVRSQRQQRTARKLKKNSTLYYLSVVGFASENQFRYLRGNISTFSLW